MRQVKPFASMPPSSSAWVLLRVRFELVTALTLSVAVHLIVWFASPQYVQAWREPPAARYDAVLVPAIDAPSASLPATTARPRRNASLATKAAPTRPKTPFVAPENAIVVDRAPQTGDEGSVIAVVAADEKSPSVEERRMDATVVASVADAGPPTLSDAAKLNQPEPAELPSRIAIAYKMTSSISDGVAHYVWTRDGDRFEIDSSMQATGFIVGNFVGVLHQVSRGLLTPAGLQPGSFQIRRGDGAPDTAEFLRASSELRLTRAGEARSLPLPPLIQDTQSFLFQLAYDAPRLKHPEDRLDVLVTNGRKVYRHQFKQVGIETLQARAGPIQAMHLRSEARDPEDVYEVWLALDNYYLAVKIRFYAGRFPVELIATSIRTTP